MNDYDGETDDRGTEVPEVGGFPFVITFYPRFEAANGLKTREAGRAKALRPAQKLYAARQSR